VARWHNLRPVEWALVLVSAVLVLVCMTDGLQVLRSEMGW